MVSLTVLIMRGGGLTRYNITSIHSILVLNEAEAIHELDLSDLTSSMRCEVGLHIGLGGCNVVSRSLFGCSRQKVRVDRWRPETS
jgi:hypothetical protein